MSKGSILIVDDEKAQLEALAGFLKKLGYAIYRSTSPQKGLEIVQSEVVDVVVTDFRMPEMSGIAFLKKLKAMNPEISVVVMTAFGSVENAVEAMQMGATDYLQKPLDLDQVEWVIKRSLQQKLLASENRRLREELANRFQFKGIVSVSPEMESVLNLAGRIARSNASVLIRGESGTGKELIARAIHFSSDRHDKPFVAVNLAALPESLIESELFGHEKGAFTGAHAAKKGRLQLAEGGTLFLDEVGDIPPAIQIKLLRVLQEREYETLGGTQTQKANVRIVAATNRNLEEMIQKKEFREDLFYRLNVATIYIPPLRKRRLDIPVLIDYFVRKFAEENKKTIAGVSREALDVLLKYDYPGNIRELENIIQQAVVLARDNLITTEDLPLHVRPSRVDLENKAGQIQGQTLPEKVAFLEKHLILEALKDSDGNQSKAARRLGITERNLRYKIAKYALK